MPILECPSIVCNVFGFTPPSMHLAANVCRSTCMENLGIPILSHCLNNIVSYVLFLTGVPFLHRKTCSDHSKPTSSPVRSPVCNKNLYWYSYVFPAIHFTNLFCCSNVSASFFCVGSPISDFTIPLQGFFIITSFDMHNRAY